MEDFERWAMLYDFYGPLLTQKQSDTFRDYVLNDLSLSEIAEDTGISRQAVYDMIKRIKKILEDYENRLMLLDRFLKIRGTVEQIDAIAADSSLYEIRKLTQVIMEDL